jgi:predicted P-loop ATPase
MATIRRMGVATADDAIAVVEESGWNQRCVPPWDIDGSQGLRRKYTESRAPIGDPPRARAPAGPAGEAPRVTASDVLREARGETPPDPPTDDRDPLVLDRDPSVDKNGRWLTNFRNTVLWVRHESGLADRLAWNAMTLQPELDGQPLRDADVGRIREQVEASKSRMTPGREMVVDAIARVADAHAYHPIRRYLSGLEWDGVERINRVGPVILGVADTEIHRAMLRCFFVGAVARAMSPGCKLDTVLVLVGPEGLRKSSFFSALGGSWFSDSAVDLSKNDAYLQVHSAWIYEWSELDALTSRTHNGRVRSFLSSAADLFRAPYGRAVTTHPRTTVIVGSLNPTSFLADPEGDRRFHPLSITRRIDLETAVEWRDQLWAEAVRWHEHHTADRADPAWRYWLSDAEEALRGAVAAEHRTEDPWQDLIDQWCRGRAQTTTREIAGRALMIPDERIHGHVGSRIAAVMRRIGWKSGRVGGSRGWLEPSDT